MQHAFMIHAFPASSPKFQGADCQQQRLGYSTVNKAFGAYQLCNMNMNHHHDAPSEVLESEITPLMGEEESPSAATKKKRSFVPVSVWISGGILMTIIVAIAAAILVKRQEQATKPQPQQTVIVVPDYNTPPPRSSQSQSHSHYTEPINSKTKTTDHVPGDDREPSILADKVPFRAICDYYPNHRPSRTRGLSDFPKIIQTSLQDAAIPWSTTQPCRVHSSFGDNEGDDPVVHINVAQSPDAIIQVQFSAMEEDTTTFQQNRAMPTILGFGGAFTEATSLNVQRLSKVAQQVILELFFGATGLGYSMGRIPIHSCDFSVESYTFDDVVDDIHLQHFDTSLRHDHHTIQFVKQAIQTYHEAWVSGDASPQEQQPFKLIGSPWSPPSWMKRPTWEDDPDATHAAKMTYSAQPNCLRDGVGPQSKYAQVWAKYIAKYISSYETLLSTLSTTNTTATKFWAITVQNEPEFAAPWEACSYTARNMTDFVAYHLGPILRLEHPQLHILAFDHNKDHINAWMIQMLNTTKNTTVPTNASTTSANRTDALLTTSSRLAAKYISGTAYHWYAGGMDRLLDGALGTPNLHRFQENLAALDLDANSHFVLGTEACHCPTTGYAGGDISLYWSRAERYAHTILADLAAGSQGWVEWNLVLDGIGGPNHLGNVCDAPVLAVPHRALNAENQDISPLPDFEMTKPMGGQIIGDGRTREELNALGFPAKYLDLGIAVQPMYYYMGHISRHVRPGSMAVPAIVLSSLGNGDIFRPVESNVAGGGQNDLARDGIELLLWPCEGSTRQQFKWNYDESQHIVVFGHDWLGNQTKSCIGRAVDEDFMGMRLTTCTQKTAGKFEVMSVADDDQGRYMIRLLNHPTKNDNLCLTILELKNGGGAYGPMGGGQVALGDCSHPSAKWALDLAAGEASSTYFAKDASDNNDAVCITTGWPFLQVGAFLTPNGSAPKTVVVLNEAKNSANYAIRDGDMIILTGSIPPRSIQTILLE